MQHDRQPERIGAADLADVQASHLENNRRPAHQAEIARGLAGMASIAMRNVWHTSPAIRNVGDRVMTVDIVMTLEHQNTAEYPITGKIQGGRALPSSLRYAR